ncbi:MAG: mechanosensitive ion channel [Phycisphaerales bacterium]|nr:mechanosensitive ion channel [Phycisphaerales bacterium]
MPPLHTIRKTELIPSGQWACRTRMVLVAVIALAIPSTMIFGATPYGKDSPGRQDAIEPIASESESSPETVDMPFDDVADRIADVQKALHELRENPSADSARIQLLESRLKLLRQIQDGREKTKSLRSQSDGTTRKRADLEARLDAAQRRKPVPPVPEDASEDEIREQVNALDQSIEDSEAQNKFIVSSQNYRLRRRQELRELESKNLSTFATIDATSDLSPIDRKLQLEQIQVEQKLIAAERAMFKTTDPNLMLSRKVLELESEGLRKELAVWQEALNERTKASARQLASDADQAARNATHPEVRSQAEQNRSLAERLEQVHVDTNSKIQQLDETRQRLEDIRRQRMLDESRVVRNPTAESVEQMRTRFTSFPDISQINIDIATEQRLIQSAKDQLDFLQTLNWLSETSNVEARITDVEEADQDEEPSTHQQQLEEISRIRQEELVAPLRSALEDRIDTLSNLLALQQSLLVEIKRYKQQVLDRTIWIRDPNATTATNYRLVLQQLKKIFSPSAWNEAFGVLVGRIMEHPFFAAFGVVPLLLFITLHRLVRRKIRVAGIRVSHRETDSIGETMQVFLIALLSGVAWAGPAFVASILLQGHDNETSLILSLDRSMTGLWQILFLAGFVWSMLAPDGLVEKHFLYNPARVRRARATVLVGLAIVPFIFLCTICRPGGLDFIPAGRLLFTPVPALLAIMAWLLLRPFHQEHEHKNGTEVGFTRVQQWSLLGLVIGLLLFITVAANLGWYRLVMSFQRSVLDSVLLILGVLLVRALLLRFLRARHRNTTSDLIQQEDRGEDVSEEADELERLDTRTLRAIRFSVVTGIIVGLYWIWQSVFPAFAGLDHVVMWADGAVDLPSADLANTDSRLIITLGDLLRCFVAIVASWYTARNLPSLIELVIVERFKLERGINYAITQLLQWVLLIGGLAYSASFLDISWSSVQWLAAGLTVGLGFGLQEIFANFISGLIILFERPIRLGDVVTVGTTNGRVSRIRMRSTTISDWDRKELVVPNKKFVTEEIVNWSIGDACIRLVLPIGVSYDEDPTVVAEILCNIGNADPEVLDEPAPRVIFHSFGNNSLDFELRLYLPSTENMSKVRTRINTAIKQKFDAAGITIPFPQRDIRVEMVRPDAPETGPAMPLPTSGAPDPSRSQANESD